MSKKGIFLLECWRRADAYERPQAIITVKFNAVHNRGCLRKKRKSMEGKEVPGR